MHIWIAATGEPLPIDSLQTRPFRNSLIARAAVKAGHQVTWWTATFDHAQHAHRFQTDQVVDVDRNFKIRLLHSPGYKKNISLRRIIDHSIFARRLKKQIVRAPVPDFVLASFPTPETASVLSTFCAEREIPLVVDLRDLWPDVFLDAIPPALKTVSAPLMSYYRFFARKICRNATAIISPNRAFVDWGIQLSRRNATTWDQEYVMAYEDTVPNSAEIEAAEVFWRERGIDRNKSVICFAGTLGNFFDITTVIEAAKCLEGEFPDVRFVICGTGHRFIEYKYQGEKLSNMLFPGLLDHSKLWVLYQMSDLSLAPYIQSESFDSSFPNKAGEYLASGLPVLTTLKGRLGSYLRENQCGFIYDGRSVVDLVSKIRACLVDRITLKHFSSNARYSYDRDFRSEVVYGKLVCQMEKMIAANSKKRPLAV